MSVLRSLHTHLWHEYQGHLGILVISLNCSFLIATFSVSGKPEHLILLLLYWFHSQQCASGVLYCKAKWH